MKKKEKTATQRVEDSYLEDRMAKVKKYDEDMKRAGAEESRNLGQHVTNTVYGGGDPYKGQVKTRKK